jgi:hypothetical protein
MDHDPLEELLLDASKVDRARLARALNDILGIDAESGRVVLMPGFGRLSTRNKVLAYLLGRKAAMLLGRIAEEVVDSKDVPRETGVPSGTVYPDLKTLHQANLISQMASGE